MSRRLPQSCQRRLVIKDCLIQSAALFDQRCLRVSDLDYLSFTGTVTRDRGCEIVLCFDYAFARETNPRRSARCLRASGVKLLREPTKRQRSFVLGDLNAQTRVLEGIYREAIELRR